MTARASSRVRSVGTLFVVATPIGNMEDITARAVRILGEVDTVLAEDTRRTRRLLAHFGIDRPVTAHHDHNERSQVKAIVAELLDGARLALVSDAGTPLLSDPGFPLVQAAGAAGRASRSGPRSERFDRGA